MYKVIIADDEIKICELLERLVDWKSLGFEIVAIAHNGLDVLRYVKEFRPEIIITDIQMPACNGLELLEKIRAEQADIDVLVISGYREFEYAKTALQYGAENYLLKPIKRSELLDSLMNIKQRREGRAAEQEKIAETEQFLNSSVEKLQSTLIADIVQGRRIHLLPQEMQEEYRLGFSSEHLSFMTLKLDFVSQDMNEKVLVIIQQKALRSVSALLNEAGISSCCTSDQNLLYALIDTAPESLEQVCSRMIRSIRDFVGYDNEVQVTVGLSEVFSNNVYDAMLRSRNAAYEQLYRGRNCVIHDSQNDTDAKPGDYLTEPLIRSIHNRLVALDEKGLCALFDGLIRQLRFDSEPPVSGISLYHIMSALINQLFSQLKLIDSASDLSEPDERYRFQLRMCGKWSEYEDLFRALSTELVGMLHALHSEKEKRPIKEAKRMIEDRFRTALTLEEISDALGLNSSYLSAIFKKETGITVSAYITRLRIDDAKKRLVTTEDSLSEIAEAVGYSDEKYFMRRFKKEVGLTPGEYRRLYG